MRNTPLPSRNSLLRRARKFLEQDKRIPTDLAAKLMERGVILDERHQ